MELFDIKETLEIHKQVKQRYIISFINTCIDGAKNNPSGKSCNEVCTERKDGIVAKLKESDYKQCYQMAKVNDEGFVGGWYLSIDLNKLEK